MTTESRTDSIDQRLESALTRLPEWQVPSDFAVRLAAAAVRQLNDAPVPVPEPAWAVVLDFPTRLAPAAWSAGIAAVLAWAVPWSALAAGSALVVWACVALMGAAGLALTVRVLRAPD